MPWYLISADDEVMDDEPTMFSNGFNLLMMFFLILYSMMPATLFVSCNLIYLNASMYMSNDFDMYHEEADEPCQVRQMSLVDELGQVSHIFSDKTGTLTSNHMEFRRVEIDGTSYGVGETAISSHYCNGQTERDGGLRRRAGVGIELFVNGGGLGSVDVVDHSLRQGARQNGRAAARRQRRL